MSEQMLVQCQLRHDDEIMVTYLDTKKTIKVGDRVSLKTKDDGRLWTIESIGQPTRASSIHRDWNNNI
jgi:hypothetical protein